MIPLGCCSSIVRENPRLTALPTRESESRDLFVAIVVVVVRGKYLDLSESREYIVNFAGVHVTHTGLGFHMAERYLVIRCCNFVIKKC